MKCLLLAITLSGCATNSGVRSDIIEAFNEEGCKISEYKERLDKYEFITVKFK